jgi:hypothetical protein
MGALGNQQVAKKLAALGIQVFDKARGRCATSST